MPTDPVYFVHISDSHIGPSPDFELYGENPFACASQAVSVINSLRTRPHFVVHTGDIVSDPDPRSFALAASVFSKLEVPIYFVNGNHDSATGIRRHFTMGPRLDVDEGPLLSYAFEIGGYRFLVLDAKGPPEIDPQGLLPDSQMELLARETQPEGLPLVIFLHFPILTLNSIWMDNNMLVRNGLAMHALLKQASNRLVGVFFGHVHQHMQIVRDGILNASVASTFSQFGAWTGDVDTFHDLDHDPGYGFIHLLPNQIIIHQHTFPRPFPNQ